MVLSHMQAMIKATDDDEDYIALDSVSIHYWTQITSILCFILYLLSYLSGS